MSQDPRIQVTVNPDTMGKEILAGTQIVAIYPQILATPWGPTTIILIEFGDTGVEGRTRLVLPIGIAKAMVDGMEFAIEMIDINEGLDNGLNELDGY